MLSRWLKVLFLGISVASSAVLAQETPSGSGLPDFGDSSGSLISPVQEQELGEAFMRSIRSQVSLVNDPDIDAYISRLGERLVANSDAPNYPFTFFVVQDPTVNAFAGPGGYIGVHSGLILTAQNESELAGVLAHEIAHVTQRHLLRAYESASQLSLPTAAAMIAAILVGATTDSEAGMAAATAIQAGNIQHQLNFTRANEKEADRIGIQTLARSDIDTFGMPAFFERLHQSTRLYGGNIPEFLRTHPVTSDRIAESLQRAERYGRGKRNDSTEFQLIRARLQVQLAHNPQNVVQQYQELVKKNPSAVAAQYGLALALWRTGNSTETKQLLQRLMDMDPDRALYRTTLAQVELENGESAKALKLYKDTLDLYPGDLLVGQYYAAALIRAGQAAEAREHILRMLREEKARTATMYELWAKAASITGPAWETKQATAEVYFMNGNLRLAIDQLRQALQLKGLSQYEQARIQARLQEFKQMLSEREKR